MRNTRTIAAVALLIAVVALVPMGCKSKKKSGTEPTTQNTAVSQPTGEATSPAGTTPEATQSVGNPLGISPCGLISKDVAYAGLGEEVQDGQASAPASLDVAPGLTVSAASCDYTSKTTAHYIGIDFWAASSDKAAEVQQAITAVCSGKEAISDLGDVACWYDSDHTELQVAKGAAFLDLTISTASNAEGTLKILAQAALANLP
jgi:hypothetical protein